ncbi:gamma-glutamylcyclotransferase family protein [Falsiroseomonas oryziterrae]|uniref:gamma-glutamylcyclotransferase family protein n=1 Tax=Falsiroseomonas oryziterrae TaxID=2911368 RepID=UPI001F213DA9|nr:gamma-glutamylcyclotransferase family protein [Roseomonas sp. NPKOSM-4]
MGAARRIFVYGTLLDPRVFRRHAELRWFRRALPARLPGHRRVRLRGTPYPTLVEGAGEVRGLLLPRLPPATLARLARYEGAGYALRPLRVVTRRGRCAARGWVSPRWRSDPTVDWFPSR